MFCSNWFEMKFCHLYSVQVIQSCLTLCNRTDYTVHGILQARILESVTIPFSRGSSQPRNQTQVSRIAGRFFTNWEKSKNTGVGSLSLLMQNLLTQESNQGLLHCRRILNQLSYARSPLVLKRTLIQMVKLPLNFKIKLKNILCNHFPSLA